MKLTPEELMEHKLKGTCPFSNHHDHYECLLIVADNLKSLYEGGFITITRTRTSIAQKGDIYLVTSTNNEKYNRWIEMSGNSLIHSIYNQIKELNL